MGDFNVDLMRHNAVTSNKGMAFLNISFLHGLLPSCLLPSRICDNHATLIDNIFTSQNCFDNHIILNDTSDHCVVVSDFPGSGMERGKRPNKIYKNRLTFVLREAEAKYYQRKFRECDSPRKSWKIINERINNVKTRNFRSHLQLMKELK